MCIVHIKENATIDLTENIERRSGKVRGCFWRFYQLHHNYMHWCTPHALRLGRCVFCDISAKWMQIAMSFGRYKPILKTHFSYNFHQLSITQSWDIAKNLLFECALQLGRLVTKSKHRLRSSIPWASACKEGPANLVVARWTANQ